MPFGENDLTNGEHDITNWLTSSGSSVSSSSMSYNSSNCSVSSSSSIQKGSSVSDLIYRKCKHCDMTIDPTNGFITWLSEDEGYEWFFCNNDCKNNYMTLHNIEAFDPEDAVENRWEILDIR